jgi:hypothetical protein
MGILLWFQNSAFFVILILNRTVPWLLISMRILEVQLEFHQMLQQTVVAGTTFNVLKTGERLVGMFLTLSVHDTSVTNNRLKELYNK